MPRTPARPGSAGRDPAGTMKLMLAATLVLAAGCAHGYTGLRGAAGTSPAPNVPWSPSPEALAPMPKMPTRTIPPEILAGVTHLSLAQVADIALRNSTQTQQAWDNARAAAAAYGAEKGTWYPEADVTADYSGVKSLPSGDTPATPSRSYGPTLNVSWLLFNFGGRAASVAETRDALEAADWTHNASIQNVILQVEQAYFGYTSTRALVAAEQSSLKDAQANLDAAQARHDAGLGTIADVLQAKTALSQEQLTLETLEGQIETTRGALATAMGLSADTQFDVELSEGPPPTESMETIDRCLEQAEASRPDLAAARAQADRAAAEVRRTKAALWPTFSVGGSVGRAYMNSPDRPANTWSTLAEMQWPIFTGFSNLYDVKQARALADASEASFQGAQQAVALQVWTSYYLLKTAQQRLATSADLFASATQNRDVAAGRYQTGVGTILDLLSAQAALEVARATQVEARADWDVALAQLAHDTGTLGPVPVSGIQKEGGK